MTKPMTSDSEGVPTKIDFESVKKGDIFWEDSQYGSIQVEALTDAKVTNDYITFLGRTHNDKVEYLANKTAMHYAPRLCTQPCYHPATRLDGSDGHKVTNKPQNEAPSVLDELDDIFGKYMTWSGLEYTIKIGKQVVKVKDEDYKDLKAKINRLIIEAELRGFDKAFDSHDYDRLREYRKALSNNLSKGDDNGRTD